MMRIKKVPALLCAGLLIVGCLETQAATGRFSSFWSRASALATGFRKRLTVPSAFGTIALGLSGYFTYLTTAKGLQNSWWLAGNGDAVKAKVSVDNSNPEKTVVECGKTGDWRLFNTSLGRGLSPSAKCVRVLVSTNDTPGDEANPVVGPEGTANAGVMSKEARRVFEKEMGTLGAKKATDRLLDKIRGWEKLYGQGSDAPYWRIKNKRQKGYWDTTKPDKYAELGFDEEQGLSDDLSVRLPGVDGNGKGFPRYLPLDFLKKITKKRPQEITASLNTGGRQVELGDGQGSFKFQHLGRTIAEALESVTAEQEPGKALVKQQPQQKKAPQQRKPVAKAQQPK